MNCPHCQTANPDNAKFCLNCGTSLAAVCSNCSTPLPAGAHFCMNCGQPINAATPAEDTRLTRIVANTPIQLAEKMRTAKVTGDRKVVTALFADVVGSTSLAATMDAEDWAAIMNRAFDRLSPPIYRYEGTIARLLGDAVLAFFGAPVAHEDDPVRAVRAALDMLSVARDYADEVRRTHHIEFAIRIGINTGPVVVGKVGSDLKFEYTAMGDAVNLAARMQSAARPMTALIPEQTYRFIAPVVDCTDLGLIEVKGKTDPVRVYEIRGLKTLPGKVRGLAGLESAMVGRDAELTALRRIGRAVKAGQGRVAVIVGEPGLGKTRLVAEWKAATVAVDKSTGLSDLTPSVLWAEGHCLSYGQGLAYHLIVDLLRALIGVSTAAGEPETRGALLARVDELFGGQASEGDEMDVYPYLAHLLSLPLEGEASDRIRNLDPQILQSKYVAAMRQMLKAQAGRGPLILILDDIHWADPSSTDMLIKLMPLAGELPILFCFVTRMDQDVPGWKLVAAAREASGAALTELTLSPLSEVDSRQLVSNLLEIEALPERIRALILKKAEGNPFFVEEVIRMLIDRAAIVRQGDAWVTQKEIENVEIPDNLQGLLLARIDRLPDDVKHTLRVASVIGRQFPVKVLEQVLGRG